MRWTRPPSASCSRPSPPGELDVGGGRSLAPAALRRPRLRPRRPPPPAAPGHARGGLRAGQDARAVRRHRRRAAGHGGDVRSCSPGRPTSSTTVAAARTRAGRSPARRSSGGPPGPTRPERVVIATAGTADGPVADECEAVLRAYGFSPERLDDVGVAGIHRLLAHTDTLAAADAVVVVAGMEGALASVVGGLTAAPVVAVPTSAGYGASFGGVTALLAMLISCAQGVTVVGIDNGFGAACAVTRALQPAGRSGLRAPAVAPGLVPLLLRHRRGHGARRAARRGRRRRRGPGRGRPPAGRRDGTSSRGGAARRPAATRAIVHAPEDHGPPPHVRRHPRACSARRRPARPGRAPAPSAVFTALAEAEGRLHGVPPTRSTSTRSARSTPSSTSSGRAPPSSCSTSTRSARVRSPSASARSGPPTVSCPTRRRRSLALLAAAGIAGDRPRLTASSWRRPPGPRCWPGWPSGSGPAPTDDAVGASATAPAGGTSRAGPTSSRW